MTDLLRNWQCSAVHKFSFLPFIMIHDYINNFNFNAVLCIINCVIIDSAGALKNYIILLNYFKVDYVK